MCDAMRQRYKALYDESDYVKSLNNNQEKCFYLQLAIDHFRKDHNIP